MAEYDTSIRVSTKVDSSELDKVAKTFKEIEGNADNAKDKVDELDKSGSNVSADGYEEQAKAIEKVNAELDRNIKKQKEAVQAQTESPDYRSAWTEEEEAHIDALIAKTKEQKELAAQSPKTEAGSREVEFDWQSNADQQAQNVQQIEEISAEMERAREGIADADEHMNQLRVDVEEYAATLKELEAQGQYFGDDDYDQVYIAWRNATDAVKEYESNLRSLTDKGMTETEARIAKEEQVNAKKREQEAEEQKLQSIRVNAQVSNQKLVDLLAEQIKLQERLEELKKAGLTAGYKEYDNITARLKQIKKQVDYEQQGFQRMGESGKKAFNKINTHAKKSGGILSTLGSRLKGIALSLLIFNWITKGFNAMVSGMKTGFQNLIQYSKDCDDAMSSNMEESIQNLTEYSNDYNDAMSSLKSANTQLNNSLATAFAPIVQIAIPYLVQLINYVTMAANKVAQFMATLQGKSTWIKATAVQEDYADALDSTSKSAKKAAGALAAFDTLEVLSKKDSGSGAGGTSPKDMFEEVKTDDQAPETKFAKRIKEAIDKEDWFALGQEIGKKLSEVLESINWDNIYGNVDRFGTGLADFLNGLISPRLFSSVGKTIARSLNTVLHSLDSFGHTFDWKNFGTSLAAGLNSFFMNFDFKLLADTVNVWAEGLLDTLIEFVQDADWAYFGYKLGEFITGIDFTGILQRVGKLIWEAINAAVKFYIGLFSAAPIETAIITALTLMKFTGVTESIVASLKEVVSGALISLAENPITWAIAIPVAIILLADTLDSTLIDLEIAKYQEKQVKEYGDTVDNLVSKTKQLTDEIDKSKVAFDKQIESKDDNILYLETLAKKYGELSGKTNLTAEEQKLLSQYTKELVDNMPELNEYYDQESEKLTITTDKLKELIKQKEKQIKLEAISESWKEALRQEADAQILAKENAANLAQAQEKLSEATKKCNDELAKSGGNANLAPYQQEVAEATNEVEQFGKALAENKKQLDELSNRSDSYAAIYESVSAGAENAKSSARTSGQEIAEEYANGISDNADLSTEEIDRMVQNAQEQLNGLGDVSYDSGKGMVDSYSQGAFDESESKDYSALGENIKEGLTEPIEEADTGILIVDLFKRLKNTICDVFGIHSPAAEMKPLGEFIFLGIVEGFASKFDAFTECMTEFWNTYVQPWFTTEKWLEVTQGILDGISGKWDELVAFWGPAIKDWWDTHIEPWFTAERWKTLGENMKKGIHNGFVGIVSKIVDVLNKIIESCESMINTVVDKINQFMQDAIAMVNKIPGVSFETHTISHVQFGRVEMPDIPMLANGAVIRGGNPFAAILGDQPVGQTNIEAPLSTIEDAVRNVVGDRSGGVLNVNLNYDGETFARLSLQDFLNEMNRQGYDIDVLGGMS